MSALAGNDAPRGKHVYSWNLIGTPHAYQGGCADGRRIFVERDANNAHIKIVNDPTLSGTWRILECDGTGTDTAVIQSSLLGSFDVYVRILGENRWHTRRVRRYFV